MKFYTGIGSRETPKDILGLMYLIAVKLAKNHWVLRSGGAEGADRAFEEGAGSFTKQIFLPWKNFNDNPSRFCNVSETAIKTSLKFHPTPEKLGQGVRKIMGRNLYQVMGLDLNTPSVFLVCWTPFATEDAYDKTKNIGGTGQAIRIAMNKGIPVFNLNTMEHRTRLKEFVS